MALELNGTTGVSLVQDGVVTAADLSSTLDLSSKTLTLPAANQSPMTVISSSDTFTSGASTIDIDLPTDSSYRYFKLILTGVYGSVGFDAYTRIRLDGNTGYESGSSDYDYSVHEANGTGGSGYSASAGISYMRLCWYGQGDANNEAVDWEINIFNSNNSTGYFRLQTTYGGSINTGISAVGQSTGQYNGSTGLVDGLRFYPSGGTLSYRNYTLYGVKAS